MMDLLPVEAGDDLLCLSSLEDEEEEEGSAISFLDGFWDGQSPEVSRGVESSGFGTWLASFFDLKESSSLISSTPLSHSFW